MLNKTDEFYCVHENVLNDLEVRRTLSKKEVHYFKKPQAFVQLETPSCFKLSSTAKWCMKLVATLGSAGFAHCSSASKRKLQLSSL